MSNEEFRIPRHGSAGVAFLGVEVQDAIILIASIFLALPAGRIFGTPGYLGIPVVGYFMNTLYVDWRSKTLPGSTKAILFSLGLARYSSAFTDQRVVYLGDSNIINPSAAALVDVEIQARKAK